MMRQSASGLCCVLKKGVLVEVGGGLDGAPSGNLELRVASSRHRPPGKAALDWT